MSTLGLPGLAQHQAAGLAAVLGLRGIKEVVPEAPLQGQKARRSGAIASWPLISLALRGDGRGKRERRGQRGRHLLEGDLVLPPVSSAARRHDLQESGVRGQLNHYPQQTALAHTQTHTEIVLAFASFRFSSQVLIG